MNNTILFTVVYPGCEPYLERFFRSVREQYARKFDLMVLNDGLNDLKRYAGDLYSRIDEITVSGSIADVRRKGLQFLMNHPSEKIVFADADDYISSNRIQKADEILEKFDIYVNELSTVTSDEEVITKNYLSNRIADRHEVSSTFILNKNILGLGNTAVRRSILREIPIPSSTIAVDWMIFTDMLLRGATAIFRNDSISYYRQHEKNTVGLKNISYDKIRRGLKVQIQNAEFFADESEQHKNHLEKLHELQSYFSHNHRNIAVYLEKVEEVLPEYPLWWEEIQPLDQLNI